MTTKPNSTSEKRDFIMACLLFFALFFLSSFFAAKMALLLVDVNIYLVGSEQCTGEYITTTKNWHE